MTALTNTTQEAVSNTKHTIFPNEQGRFVWGNGAITMVFEVSDSAPVRLVGLSGQGMTQATEDMQAEADAQPIVEIRSSRDSGDDNRLKLAYSAAGRRLRFVEACSYEQENPAAPIRLMIVQHDKERSFQVISVFEAFRGISAVRCCTIMKCDTTYPIEAVSSINMTLPLSTVGLDVQDADIYWGNSSWDLENDWHRMPLRNTTLRDRNQVITPGMASARFALSSSSTWSSGEHEPAGMVSVHNDERPEHGYACMWQIEHNGAWEWEIGENDPGLRVSAYGPEYDDHQWFTMLGTNNVFRSVPVSFAIGAGDWQEAVAHMTAHRRALRQQTAIEQNRKEQEAHSRSLVIYNDYMNTLFGDPRLEKELPLVEGVSRVGADIFCIDAGWYDSTDGGWWDMVGQWEPSMNRFGSIRLAGLAHIIQAHGMGLGLWLEPEVIGVKSPLASQLPDSAFFCRHGERVSDQGRYHLDFRSPIARDHATATVNRLIEEFNVKYFKFDYNTMPGPGTDVNTDSVGEGLLEHCRAVQDWIDSIRKAHPDVTIENCGSGAMRADFAMLSRLDIQSTSDQSDPVVYAAIASMAGMTVLPEQQGNWGYAQEEMNDETAVFTLAAGILGRLYLSGFINRMSEPRLALVRDAIALQRTILREQEHMVPWWPYDLQDFNAPWLVYGLRHHSAVDATMQQDTGSRPVDYVTIWRRSGAQSIYLPLEEGAHLTQVFPDPNQPQHAQDAQPWTVERADPTTVHISAATDDEPSARIFAISYEHSGNNEDR